jgi:hypothetical protein
VPKLPPIVVAIVAAIAALSPVLAPLAGYIPPTWMSVISEIIGLAGFLHNWLAAPSLADKAMRARVEDYHAKAAEPHVKALLARLLGLPIACLCLVLVSGCAWWSSNGKTVVSVVETVACDVAEAADPTMAVLICGAVDATGALVEAFTPVTTDAAAAAQWAKRFPSTPAVHALVLARPAVKR